MKADGDDIRKGLSRCNITHKVSGAAAAEIFAWMGGNPIAGERNIGLRGTGKAISEPGVLPDYEWMPETEKKKEQKRQLLELTK